MLIQNDTDTMEFKYPGITACVYGEYDRISSDRAEKTFSNGPKDILSQNRPRIYYYKMLNGSV